MRRVILVLILGFLLGLAVWRLRASRRDVATEGFAPQAAMAIDPARLASPPGPGDAPAPVMTQHDGGEPPLSADPAASGALASRFRRAYVLQPVRRMSARMARWSVFVTVRKMGS